MRDMFEKQINYLIEKHLPVAFIFNAIGIAIIASTARIPTTIKNSTSEKPRLLLILFVSVIANLSFLKFFLQSGFRIE